MKKYDKKIKVALLFGGHSAEHEVSLVSSSSIYNNLDKKKYEILLIYINKEGRWKIVDSPLLSPPKFNKEEFSSFLPWEGRLFNKALSADIYFPVLHGPFGEDGTIQGLLEMADVPYVGASVAASAIAMDKALTKIILKMKNLPVVSSVSLLESEWIINEYAILSKIRESFNLPFFVKPANLGSSVGITKVQEYSQTKSTFNTAFKYDKKIIVEDAIKGRELECSILGNDDPKASLPGEIIPFREFYDYRDKYIEGKTNLKIPAELSSSIVREIQGMAIEAFKAIGCTGMARVDFFLQDKTEKLFVNEINTIPGFTEISMYPKLWEASGITFPSLLDKLIEFGFEKHKKKKRGRESVII